MSGERIVLTRAADGAAAWRARLAARGLAVHVLPLLQHVPLPVPASFRERRFDWILFTSPRAVRMFFAAGLRSHGARLGAVGRATEQSLNEQGVRATIAPVEQDGAGLAHVFRTHEKTAVTVLLPGALQRLPEPRRSLERGGHQVTELPLYRTDPVPRNELPRVPCRDGDVVFFASPSAVRAWVAAWPDRPPCVAIGRTTAAACREAGFPTSIAVRPDLDAMVAAAGLAPRFTPEDS